MHCASCANTIEERLLSVKKVSSASVNSANNTVLVVHEGVPVQTLINQIKLAGYSASEHPPLADEHHKVESFPLIACFAGFFLLVLSMGHMLGLPIHETVLNAFLQFLLASYLLFVNKEVFRQGLLVVWRTKTSTMDTLVALGVGSAYLYSSVVFLYGVFSPPIEFSQLFFESAGIILLFVQIGRYFEFKATRRAASRMKGLLSLASPSALVVDGSSEQEVLLDEVVVGSIVKVKPGMRIPLDGVIHVGATRIDESLVTGESVPVKKTKGDVVFGGSINKTGMVLVRVTASSQKSTVQRIADLVEEAQSSKAPIQRVVDKVASRFVPFVLLLAVLTFVGWLLFPPLEAVVPLLFALQASIAVLVIACPCALGLATPTAVMVSMGEAGKQGVVFSDAATLQAASSARTVVFDKTGTLTVGKPVVSAIKTYNDLSSQVVFRYAASLASTSTHPLSEAIVSYAKKQSIGFGSPRQCEEVEGKGLVGKVEGRKIVVGSVDFFVESGIGLYDVREKLPSFASKQYTPVLVAVEGRIAALIGISDALKDSAKAGVEAVHALGLQTVMLTGDRQEIAESVASSLGVGVVRAQLSPQQKLEEITRMRKKRGVVMVGDGINDAPALAAADVGVVLSNSTEVASEASSVRVMSDDVTKVAFALGLSRRTMRVVKQNLAWAFSYNVLAIPIAMGVLYPFTGWLLSPMIAGAAMAASSLSVVLNSLRLK